MNIDETDLGNEDDEAWIRVLAIGPHARRELARVSYTSCKHPRWWLLAYDARDERWSNEVTDVVRDARRANDSVLVACRSPQLDRTARQAHLELLARRWGACVIGVANAEGALVAAIDALRSILVDSGCVGMDREHVVQAMVSTVGEAVVPPLQLPPRVS